MSPECCALQARHAAVVATGVFRAFLATEHVAVGILTTGARRHEKFSLGFPGLKTPGSEPIQGLGFFRLLNLFRSMWSCCVGVITQLCCPAPLCAFHACPFQNGRSSQGFEAVHQGCRAASRREAPARNAQSITHIRVSHCNFCSSTELPQI